MLYPRLLRLPTRQLDARSSFLSRTLSCRPPRRAFHASTAQQGPGLDTLLYLPHEIMSLIHANVPWYAAIPLTAFIVRGALVTTAGAYVRSRAARNAGLHPLRQALAFQVRDETLKRRNFRTPKEAMAHVKTEVKKTTRQLDERWKPGSIKASIWWTAVQLPVFFAMAEAIRQKCGARDGLLGLGASLVHGVRDRLAGLQQHFFGIEDAGAGPMESAVHSTSEVDALDDAFESGVDSIAARPILEDGKPAATSTSDVSELDINPSQWFDPSLANEGMLWFQDLVIPDPTGILPFVVSGLMFCNIYFTKNVNPVGPNWQTALRRLLLSVSLLVGPFCQDLPAALMLYWASSTSSVIVWNWWLDWKYPSPSGHTACKRKLIMPPALVRKSRRV
ncbi:hypothetical protein IAQ61_000363 [Plenodomus lingam]|uniref:uncharacterized protein n=1 Tax=Leptosphaeria maculans TaxID=5022 RepID=UPI00332F25B0|nr:hypothetical protein IAQ61_000363 [Plenodomus lingam]